MSDGFNIKDFIMTSRFAYLFKAHKIAVFSVVTILELKKKHGRPIITNMRTKKCDSAPVLIGNPVNV